MCCLFPETTFEDNSPHRTPPLTKALICSHHILGDIVVIPEWGLAPRVGYKLPKGGNYITLTLYHSVSTQCQAGRFRKGSILYSRVTEDKYSLLVLKAEFSSSQDRPLLLATPTDDRG